MNTILHPVITKLRSLSIDLPPSPWAEVTSIAIGGLTSVGWIDGSDYLLVCSSQGRSIVDCCNGEKIARDRSEYHEDEFNLEAEAIGDFTGITVRVAGIFGGGLPVTTKAGWHLFIAELDWPEKSLFLVEPGSNVFGSLHGHNDNMTKIGSESELRAAGFSPTGTSLIVATNSDLTIYRQTET